MLSEASTRLLEVRNEVFNEISNLGWGSSVIVLDETHFESLLFIGALLRDAFGGKACVVAPALLESPLRSVKLDLEELESLNDISIVISQIREELKPRGIIVHHYLPNLLVRENENEVLKMLEFWTEKTAESNLIEFYTLPRNTFLEFERKVASFFHGEIVVKFSEAGKRELAFQLKKICKPQFHLEDFQFQIKDEKLLIRWGDYFTDRIPIEESEEIRRRVDYLKENPNSIVLRAKEFSPREMSTYENWLLSQVEGKRLSEVQLLFPDVFGELVEALARLNIRNVIGFQKSEEAQIAAPKALRLTTRLSLMFPTWLASRLLFRKGRYVTMDAFMALRSAIEAFVKHTPAAQAERMEELERYYLELSSRTTAVERIARNKEDPRVKFDLKYFDKIVSLTLRAGFNVNPRIYRIPGEMYEINVKNCPICRDQKSAEPMCHLISGAIRGVCGVTFKRRFSCEETKCIASGDEACVFVAKAF